MERMLSLDGLGNYLRFNKNAFLDPTSEYWKRPYF